MPYSEIDKYRRCRSVVKLSEENKLIDEYPSLKQAAELNFLKSGVSISNACRGKNKTAGGYKWMYKDDYDKMKDNEDIYD